VCVCANVCVCVHVSEVNRKQRKIRSNDSNDVYSVLLITFPIGSPLRLSDFDDPQWKLSDPKSPVACVIPAADYPSKFSPLASTASIDSLDEVATNLQVVEN
jgi:hypothetical protein